MTLRGLRGIEPALGRYDFDADCVKVDRSDWRRSPVRPSFPSQVMFTVRIFPFVERADGGLKRGKAVKRIRGRFGSGDHAPERAFEEAERVCGELAKK